MITWHARVYNLRKYRPTTAYCIKLGKSGTRRSPGGPAAVRTPEYVGITPLCSMWFCITVRRDKICNASFMP